MKILVTNDDGIKSPGLHALCEALGQDHEVWTVSPAEEKSATSHSITIRDAVRTARVEERLFSCWGTPVDCVLLAVNGLVPVTIEFVISGINLGANCGSDIIFSGTAAAARQAAMLGLPAVAVSINAFNGPFHFETATGFVVSNLDRFKSLWRGDHFLNINVPNQSPEGVEAHMARPSMPVYEHSVHSFTSPSGDDYYVYSGAARPNPAESEEGEFESDTTLLHRGKITVSPIALFPSLAKSVKEYPSALF